MPQVRHIAVLQNIIRLIFVINAALAFKNVHGKHADFLAFHAFDDRRHVENISRSRIHQHHALTHFRKRFSVHAVSFRIFQLRRINNHLAFRIKIVQIAAVVLAVYQHAAPDALQYLRKPLRRLAFAHNSYFLLRQNFAFQRVYRIIVYLLQPDSAFIFSERHQRKHQRKFRHGVRRKRRTAHTDIVPFRRFVIHSGFFVAHGKEFHAVRSKRFHGFFAEYVVAVQRNAVATFAQSRVFRRKNLSASRAFKNVLPLQSRKFCYFVLP